MEASLYSLLAYPINIMAIKKIFEENIDTFKNEKMYHEKHVYNINLFFYYLTEYKALGTNSDNRFYLDAWCTSVRFLKIRNRFELQWRPLFWFVYSGMC